MTIEHILRNSLEKPLSEKGVLFWFLSFILFPISFIWASYTAIKKNNYRVKKISNKVKSELYSSDKDVAHSNNCKFICVGNVSVGGTGKSPFVRYLAKKYLANKYCVAIVSRGINTKINIVVENLNSDNLQNHSEEYLSDENREHFEYLLQEFPNGSFAILQGKNRLENIKKFLQTKSHKQHIIILYDDGMQNYSIPKDFNICLWDPFSLLQSPCFAVPVGPYREGWGNNFRTLIENYEMRVWSRCHPSQLQVFKKQVIQALHKFKLEPEQKKDFIILEKLTIGIVTLINSKYEIVPLNEEDNQYFLNNMQNYTFIFGIAKPERVLKSLEKWILDNFNSSLNFSLIPVLLPDHAMLSLASIKSMQKKQGVFTTAKDYFRWLKTQEFQTILNCKRVYVCSIDVTLLDFEGIEYHV